MFRYAIFDFDGTLADTGAGVFASVQYALRSMGEPELDSETLKYFIGPPLETSFSVKCGLDSERCHEAVEKYREYYSTKGIYELEFFPSTLQTLRELKAAGVKTAVGSSKPELFYKSYTRAFRDIRPVRLRLRRNIRRAARGQNSYNLPRGQRARSR